MKDYLPFRFGKNSQICHFNYKRGQMILIQSKKKLFEF